MFDVVFLRVYIMLMQTLSDRYHLAMQRVLEGNNVIKQATSFLSGN